MHRTVGDDKETVLMVASIAVYLWIYKNSGKSAVVVVVVSPHTHRPPSIATSHYYFDSCNDQWQLSATTKR